jgi:2-succinyl-5-enolpyruvyl-6-hydroxy-3-cyclohexene-1-carboxylate synthase
VDHLGTCALEAPPWPVLLLSVNDSAYRAAALFVDTLARLGLRHACITPGSRSTPLSLAFAEHQLVTDWIHHDERSSSFFALGIAKTTRTPVAIVTTSGTAAAELLPAAVEARYAGVPLLLLTADRPPELRGIGAPQTIDQVGLFSKVARTSLDVLLAEMAPSDIENVAVAAWTRAEQRPRRPVHVNVGFREPFVPSDLTAPTSSVAPRRLAEPRVDETALGTLARLLSGRRTLILGGPIDEPGFPAAVTRLARRAGWPIVADPLSQLRAGSHDRSRIITAADALFASGRFPSEPEAVIRFGGPVTSKALTTWLAEHPDVPQIIVDEEEGRDPTATSAFLLNADPVAVAAALRVEPAPTEWAASWIAVDRRARTAMEGSPFPSGPAAVQVLAETLPGESMLYVASSMPIRDVDRFFPAVDREIRILANRGANGIDGLVSSGLGAAATGRRTCILAGDLSMLHDVGALATAARLHLPVTIVVVNNDGGGIFSFMPQSRLPRHFERVFATPHGLSFVPIAQAFGFPSRQATSRDEFVRALQEPGLVELSTDRSREVEIRQAALARLAAS